AAARVLLGPSDCPLVSAQATAAWLPNGFNSSGMRTDGSPVLVVAAQATLGTSDRVGIYARPASDLSAPVDLCAARDPQSPEAQWLEERSSGWIEYHSGGLERPAEVVSGTVSTIYLETAASVPRSDVSDASLVWDPEGGRLLLFGGARFVGSGWTPRQVLWAFYAEDAVGYFLNVRAHERQLLRNITEREMLVAQGGQVVIISGAIVWIFFIGGLVCVFCSCPCFCFIVQSKRRAREKARNEEIMWSQSLVHRLASC
ncbi:MAG: hypothetical protein SGPRY_009621, partial [Prymnesium sp.]